MPESAILAGANQIRTTILIGALVTMLMAGLATLLVAMSVVSYAEDCFMAVLQDTAAGIDRVM